MRATLMWGMAAVSLLAGCAGPVETRYGVSGMPWVAGQSVRLMDVPVDAGQAGPMDRETREAVVAALGQQGIGITPDAPVQLEMALSERAAASGVLADGNGPLSPRKKRRLLQSCADMLHRLTLTVYRQEGETVQTSRAWAEESHCHGTLQQSLPALAKAATRALARNLPPAQSFRRGRD